MPPARGSSRHDRLIHRLPLSPGMGPDNDGGRERVEGFDRFRPARQPVASGSLHMCVMHASGRATDLRPSLNFNQIEFSVIIFILLEASGP